MGAGLECGVDGSRNHSASATAFRYTFQHGANAGDSYFTGERDYINSLKSSLEKAGYTTPELTMEKMQDHLQKIAERMTEAGGLPVAPVLAP